MPSLPIARGCSFVFSMRMFGKPSEQLAIPCRCLSSLAPAFLLLQLPPLLLPDGTSTGGAMACSRCASQRVSTPERGKGRNITGVFGSGNMELSQVHFVPFLL